MVRALLQKWQKLALPACLTAAGLCASSHLGAIEKVAAVKDLAYGAALYQYYQDDYLGALTELAVAKQQGSIQHHGNHPDLLAAGIELSYGMDKQAQALLDGIIASTGEQAVLDQAWFYSAKMLHQRGQYQDAVTALAKVKGQLPEALRDEFNYLDLYNAKHLDDKTIKQRLKRFDKKQLWLAYSFYNIAMMYYQQQDYNVAVDRLEKAVLYVGNDDEGQLLKDRIYLALAYCHLAQQQIADAVLSFKKVSLKTSWSQQALLGFGWASLEDGKPRLALAAWVELLAQSVAGAAVQEAWIGVPVIYQRLGVEQEALNLFYKAEKTFTAELEKITELQQQLTPEKVYREFVAADKQTGSSWFYRSRGLGINPVSPYLVNLLAQQAFQALLKDLRDLERMQISLASSLARSQSLYAANSVRAVGHQNQADKYQQQDIAARQRDLQQRFNSLNRAIEAKLADDSVFALTTETQADHWQRVQAAEKAAALLQANGEDVSEELALLRMYRGLLQFEVEAARPELSWQLQKRQRELQSHMAETVQRAQSVAFLVEQKPQVAEFESRIERINQQAQQLEQNLNVAQAQIKQALQRAVDGELKAQKQRIQYYLTQAKLNITKVLDLRFQQEFRQGRDIDTPASKPAGVEHETP